MLEFDPNTYGPVVLPLLSPEPLCELGPGRPDPSRRGMISALQPVSLFPQHKLADRQMALCCLAGLWLLHGFLDESHALSQEIDTPTGSYWHAIMNRREPDYGNAKYWFRRVGTHPIFPALQEAVTKLITREGLPQRTSAEARVLGTHQKWDPFLFVDLCERAQNDESLNWLCRMVAQAEWRLLFDFSYRRSIG